MSVRESSDAPYGAAEFTRWPGLLRLTLAWLLGPVLALINQQTIYAANMWVCGHGFAATLHMIPALALIATLACGATSYRDWKRVGGGVEVEMGGVATRSRFIAIGAIFINAISALVILCQWLSVFFFDPCMRA